jgi:hypothetical protein
MSIEQELGVVGGARECRSIHRARMSIAHEWGEGRSHGNVDRGRMCGGGLLGICANVIGHGSTLYFSHWPWKYTVLPRKYQRNYTALPHSLGSRVGIHEATTLYHRVVEFVGEKKVTLMITNQI